MAHARLLFFFSPFTSKDIQITGLLTDIETTRDIRLLTTGIYQDYHQICKGPCQKQKNSLHRRFAPPNRYFAVACPVQNYIENHLYKRIKYTCDILNRKDDGRGLAVLSEGWSYGGRCTGIIMSFLYMTPYDPVKCTRARTVIPRLWRMIPNPQDHADHGTCWSPVIDTSIRSILHFKRDFSVDVYIRKLLSCKAHYIDQRRYFYCVLFYIE